MKTNYLRTLAADELGHCLRFINDEFSVFNGNEDNVTANVLFAENSPFACAVPKRFTHLHINQHHHHHHHFHHHDHCSAENGGNSLQLSGKGARTSHIIENYGGCFLHASICSGSSEKEVSCQVIDRIQRHCTSMKGLSLTLAKTDAPHKSWELLEAQGATRLEKLEVRIDTCQSHCWHDHVALKLKVLDAKGSKLHQLVPVIRSCRMTLERVCIAGVGACRHSKSWGTTSWRLILEELSRCTKLRSVELSGRLRKNEHAQLLQSLGAKLEFANIQDFNETLRRQVVNSCPNLRCNLVVDHKDVRKVDFLAKHVHDLVLGNPNFCERGVVKNFSSKLTNVTKFTCLALSNRDGQLTEFFSAPKKTLENLVLSVRDFSNSPQLPQAIAKATGRLRKLFLGVDYFHDVRALTQLLRANVDLREVELVTTNSLTHARLRNDIIQIIGCLRNHRALRVLKLIFQADVDLRLFGAEFGTECLPFRSRGTKVTICHLPYS